jgi:hypothetical protein
MKIYAPLAVASRIIIYSLLMFGVAEIVKLDALFPMEDGYFGEISFTEISQEIILFALFILYMILGRRNTSVLPVTNVISLFFLASFIREFNFLIDWWIFLVIPVIILAGWFLVRDYKKLKDATIRFFSNPASTWLLSGLLLTYVFSRLIGRSSFWRILYDENSYRLAKAATEEGLELAGDVLMLISALEFFLYFHFAGKTSKTA